MRKREKWSNGVLVSSVEAPLTNKEALIEWEGDISNTDKYITRALEDIIDALPDSVKNKIDNYTLNKYSEKKELRKRKPKE